MPLGLLISGFLLGLVAAIVVWTLCDASILMSLLVLVVVANLFAGGAALWRSRRR